jgi:hypothetical protein
MGRPVGAICESDEGTFWTEFRPFRLVEGDGTDFSCTLMSSQESASRDHPGPDALLDCSRPESALNLHRKCSTNKEKFVPIFPTSGSFLLHKADHKMEFTYTVPGLAAREKAGFDKSSAHHGRFTRSGHLSFAKSMSQFATAEGQRKRRSTSELHSAMPVYAEDG